MKFIYSSGALWTILFSIKTLPRLQPSTWNVLKAAGIARKVTKRGSREELIYNGRSQLYMEMESITTLEAIIIIFLSGVMIVLFRMITCKFLPSKAMNSNTGNNTSLAVHSLSNGWMNTDTTASSGVNYNNLTYIKCNNDRLASNKQCSFRLLNCRSVCNKTDTIKDFVVDNDIDFSYHGNLATPK